MRGSGTFFDARFNDREQYPVAAKSQSGNTRGTPDVITSKLAALHFYQLAIPAPKPPVGSFDKGTAARGQVLFNGAAKCATCHVPPLFTEPGMFFKLALPEVPPLRFALDALEPYIDAETMELHHDRHHQTYVDNVNKAIGRSSRRWPSPRSPPRRRAFGTSGVTSRRDW